MSKLITQTYKLVECSELLDEFLTQATALGEKLGVVLVQLPPRLAFNSAVAQEFFAALRRRCDAEIVCEPRHASWFTTEADAMLEQLGVSRVAADPSICDAAARPGKWGGLSYWRLHGSPVIYRSSYLNRISYYASQLRQEALAGRQVWCIFDNTASSAGAGDALALAKAVSTEDG